MGHTRFVKIGAAPLPTFVKPLPPPPARQSETLYTDSQKGTSGAVSTSFPLQQGTSYTVTVQGSYSDWNGPLQIGAPESMPEFPSPSSSGRKSTQTGIDADTLFACPTSHRHPLGHWTQFEINTGSGWAHLEPEGGPFTEPTQGNVYTYTLTGEGEPASFRVNDPPTADNYGMLQIEVTA